MGYVYQMMVALFFSFGGTCVKMIRPFFPPSMITFMRFLVGILWLLLLKAVTRRRFRPDFAASLRAGWPWLLIGAVSKFLAYTAENIGLSVGLSYGNILLMPVQMVLLTVLSATVLHEGISRAGLAGIGLCVTGILLISWNGLSPEAFFSGSSLLLTGLFVAAGIFAGLFVFAQKKASAHFDILESNLCMFSVSAVLAFAVPAAEGGLLPAGAPDAACVIAILWFGFVTGIGFYINAKSIALIPFRMVAVLQSTTVFFSIAWGILFFREPVTVWIIAGTLLFVTGILLMQRRSRPSA